MSDGDDDGEKTKTGSNCSSSSSRYLRDTILPCCCIACSVFSVSCTSVIYMQYLYNIYEKKNKKQIRATMTYDSTRQHTAEYRFASAHSHSHSQLRFANCLCSCRKFQNSMCKIYNFRFYFVFSLLFVVSM